MAEFPGQVYAPPGVYTKTLFENPIAGALSAVKIPLVMGTGNEILFQEDLEVVRGSSSSADQQVPQEDLDGRAVVSISQAGQVTLGAFNGVLNRVQVRNYPIVSGDGTGTTTNARNAVSVTIDGAPIVVLSLDGLRGIVTLAQEPQLGDTVRITYYFNRTDTLITDTVSDQVTGEAGVLYGENSLAAGATYDVVAGSNDTLILTVDREAAITILLPAGSYTPAQLVAFINGQPSGTLVASTYVDNQNRTATKLTAQYDLVIGSGTANVLLGLTAGRSTARNRVFHTFQGPIVTGNNGGVTTTSVTNVTASVDNTPVIPTAVDGANRAVTLPFAPRVGSIVKITYYFNTWQNTFDYLANRDVTDVLRVGITAGRNDYIEGVDFVLQDDLVVWGTAALVSTGTTAVGTTAFGSTQISATLVDNKAYLELCTPVVQNVTPPVDSRTVFQLPFVPTTGNGRNTPLGQSLFNSVSNSRIDLPTNRPDLVTAYWGFSLQDALDRGAVSVVKVDSDTAEITLQSPIEAGASVWASFYYNILADNEYTLSVVVPGSSGIGTYTMQDRDGNAVYSAIYGTKSAGLAGITLNFPSGSETLADVHFEGNYTGSSDFQGPVEEVVTVTFAATVASPARHVVTGSSPYYTVSSASDHTNVLIDGAGAPVAGTGLDLSDPMGAGSGFFASLIGDEIVYDASTGGDTYTLDTSNNSISLSVDGVLISATVAPGGGKTAADFVTAINTAALAANPKYTAATKFTTPYTVALGKRDALKLHYTGTTAGVSGIKTITITAGTYASVTTLVAEINIQLALINGVLGLLGTVTCTANASGQLVFTLARAAVDAAGVGFLEFIDGASAAVDFAINAGIDTAGVAGAQTKIYHGPIARRYTVGTTPLNHDRIILRNRLLPGAVTMSAHNVLSQTDLTIQGSSGTAETGLAIGKRGYAGIKATVRPASLAGHIGFAGGQDANGLLRVTFYDGSGTAAQNNVFKFTLDGIPVTTVFSATGGGTVESLGTGVGSGIFFDIATAMATAGFGANAAAVIAAKLVRLEGAGLRITSNRTDAYSSLEIGTGSANSLLGFQDGASALREGVAVETLASAMMSNHAASAAFVSAYLLTYGTPAATYFAAAALAFVALDNLGGKYLAIQSQTVGANSSVIWSTASANDVLVMGTGLLTQAGDGSYGEAGIAGFYVLSSDPADGSGTANTSVFNSGVGQDGIVGQTYRDTVTGLTFTILERTGGFAYPASEYFTFRVSRTITTNANLPIRAIGGVELLVTNTAGTAASNTAVVNSYARGGNEPAVGDLYNITYAYRKQDFSTQLYTRLNAIESNYGTRSPDNPVSLASYLLLINGGVVVAIQQIEKDEGSDFASVSKYVTALDDLVKPLTGGLRPNIIVPLEGRSTDFFRLLGIHCDIQSSIRYRQERTAIFGLTPSVTPTAAGSLAQQLSNARLRMVYPDSVLLSLTDSLNQTEQYLVEGFYLAAALAGSVASPNLDVATPWTNRVMYGFDGLGRILDIVEMNEVAVQGVTVMEEKSPNIRVRQGLTTDVSNVLTRTPTITLIADEVQQQARAVLDRFIGVKYLPGILAEIEGSLGVMLRGLVRQQILAAFTGIRANVTADPTMAEVEAYYQPIFPLLYILMTFNLRSQLK
jgi:hypothetical protein